MAVREQRQILVATTEPTLAWLRLFVVALTGVALVAAGVGVEDAWAVWAVVLLATAYAATNSSLALYKRFRSLLTRRVYAVVDATLITALVLLTGGTSSPLFGLYALPLIVVVLHHGVRPGAYYSLGVSVAYAVVAQLDPPAGGPVWLAHLGLLWALYLVLAYVTTADDAREDRARRRDELGALQRAAAAPMHTGDIPTVVENLLAGTIGPANCCSAAIYLYDELDHTFTTRYSLSSDGQDSPPEQERVRVLQSDVLYQALYTGQPIAIADTHADRRMLSSAVRGDSIRSVLLAPMIAPGAHQVGVLCLARRECHRASQHEMRFAGTIAMQGAVAIRTAFLFEEAASLEASHEAEKLRGQLLATVSHELRTPIAAIQGFASSLKCADELDIPPDMERDWIDEIELNADRLRRLVTDLLDLSRLEAGALRMHIEWQDFADVIEELRPNLELLAGTRTLEIHTEDAPASVRCDAERIGQVLTNLVENAAKFSPPDSTLILGATRHEGGVLIGVRDQGEGIPEEFQEKVFERFYQVEGASGRPRGGTGLGLAICRNIVEAHGGRIWVKSCVGQGSVFYFTLPPAAPVH